VSKNITPEMVHPSHDVREEGEFVSDPVCQHCRISATEGESDRLLKPCQPNFYAERQTKIAAISAAMVSIVDERIRQIEAEGWTPEHDDSQDREQMAHAAACYAYGELIVDEANGAIWPWHEDLWKPSWPIDRRRELVKAGALIVAEIERLDRTQTKAQRP